MKKIHNIVGLALGLLLGAVVVSPLRADEKVLKSGYASRIYAINCVEADPTSLDASGCIALKELRCGSLTSLDVSGCTALDSLDCHNNALQSLNVSNCTALWWLRCDSNALTSLDVSGCPALTNLYCDNNELSSLDVIGCTALQSLWCYGNALTQLDVSGCTALQALACGENSMASLDVSGCTALQYLWCSGNALTQLDVSGCENLEGLFCWENALPSVDISRNAKLKYLNADRNAMPLSSVAKLLQDIAAYNIDYYVTSPQTPRVRLKVNEDYSLLRELAFNGIETDVTVEDAVGKPLPETLYVMGSGNISVRFKQEGFYRIRLKNTSLRSKEYDYSNFDSTLSLYTERYSDVLYPVECIVSVEVVDRNSDPNNPGGTTANEETLAAAPFAYVQGRTAYLSDGLGEVEAFTTTGQRVYRGFDRSVTLPRPGVYILRVVADGRRCKVVVK